MKNFLIIRAKDAAKKMAAKLDKTKFRPVIEPVFLIKNFSPKISETNPAAIILTSANACETIFKSKLARSIQVFAVGNESAEKLKQKGFTKISTPPKANAKSLKKFIKKSHLSKNKNLLYFRGKEITLNLACELEKSGFKVEEIFSYEMQAVQNFSQNFFKFSAENFCDYVAIFSQKTAEKFLQLVKKNNLLEYFSASQILCLSEKTRGFMVKNGFKNSVIFNEKKFYERDAKSGK